MRPLVYVTGSSGFLGSHLVRILEDKFEVETIPHQSIKDYHYKNFHTFFYLASYGNHYEQKDLELTYKANVDDLFTTLLKMRSLEFNNFIHISTSSVTIHEQTMYSATKEMAEILVKQMAKETKKRIFSVRPYSLFGEGEAEFRFIPTMIKKLNKGEVPILVPEPVHDWVYVEDMVEALIHLMHSSHIYLEPIGVGYCRPRTNLEVFNDIAKLMGKSSHFNEIHGLRTYDTEDWYKKEFDELERGGWKPIYGYQEGLKRTVKYYAK